MEIKKLIKRLINKSMPKEDEYVIDGFNLKMGAGHMLAEYQKNHKMYDRFVPFLGVIADCIGKNAKYIIDIGANVGDTAAAIIKHTDKAIICVEPTKSFFELLCNNIKKFGEMYSRRCILVNAYISNRDNENFISKVEHGTAVKIQSETQIEAPTYTLPTMLKDLNTDFNEISLIKVDTDGYDSDCIMSCGDKLKEGHVALFWENMIENDGSYTKYMNLYEYLKSCDYTDFFVFDNFGNYLTCCSSDQLKDINNYLYRIEKKVGSRSFYYVDVLGVKSEDKGKIVPIIGQYLNSFE